MLVLAGDTASQYSNLQKPYLAVLVAGFIAVAGALLVAAVAFRARPGRVARPARAHHALTGGYLAVLAAVAAVLATMALRSEDRVDAATARPALTVQVLASQWRWTFTYPNGRRTHDLVVPAHREVRFELRSQDVLHSMYIPAARFKRYAYPDRVSTFQLRFDRTGSFLGECAQFCGWNHAYMRFTLRVLDAADYATWAHGAAV
jgi:cytochrome c oxidase subunit 2